MKLGFVGLGKMGANMVRRLVRGGHEVVAWNRTFSKTEELAAEGPGVQAARTVEELVAKLSAPRIVWSMLPSGKTTEEMIGQLASLLSEGDIIVDGCNSNFHDTQRRGKALAARGIGFADAGTSGGIWGLQNGYCMMVGGEDATFRTIEPIIRTLAPADGYLHCGAIGSGHYVKMVHNGIEYGMLAAYGEGFELMNASDFKLDLPKIAELWNHSSVVRSWLLELAVDALRKEPNLDSIKGYVEDSGEGRWTVQEAIDKNIPAPIITMSLLTRLASRQNESWSAKFIAALRNEFGGHEVKEAVRT
jgi:6-phosphogluconate dehydrogenase